MPGKVAAKRPSDVMRVVKIKKAFEAAVILAGTVGWWGFVYPELSLVQEEIVTAYEENESEDIRIKSWIWEYVCQVRDENKDAVEATECEE